MGASQRRKGASGEREACKALTEHIGGTWTRSGSAQRRRGTGKPADVVSPQYPELFIEVKRGKSIGLWAALKQATEQAGDGQVPVVLARRDNGKWVVVVELAWVGIFVGLVSEILGYWNRP